MIFTLVREISFPESYKTINKFNFFAVSSPEPSLCLPSLFHSVMSVLEKSGIGKSWHPSTAQRIAKCFVAVVQSLSRVWHFGIPWTAAHQASLSFIISWTLLKLMSVELVMPSNRFILCRPLLLLPSIFPAPGSFPRSQFFTSGGQRIGVSASTSVLPMNIQSWFPLGRTGLISWLSKGFRF